MKKYIFLCVSVLLVLSCTSGRESFCFVQISDPQIGFAKGEEDNTVGWFSKTIDRILEISPDFVVCTGDMTHYMIKNKWQVDAFDSLMTRLQAVVPVYYTPGNHDYRETEWPGSREFYAGHFGDNRFCFMHKGSLFIGFDSNLVKENLVEKEKEQYEWIRVQLDKYAGKAGHIFLFHHCPVVSVSLDEEDNYSNFPEPYRSKYLELFQKYGVDAVFTGHYHRNAQMKVGNVNLVNCGSCGRPLGDFDALGKPNVCCFNVVNVNKDSFSWDFRPVADGK